MVCVLCASTERVGQAPPWPPPPPPPAAGAHPPRPLRWTRPRPPTAASRRRRAGHRPPVCGRPSPSVPPLLLRRRCGPIRSGEGPAGLARPSNSRPLRRHHAAAPPSQTSGPSCAIGRYQTLPGVVPMLNPGCSRRLRAARRRHGGTTAREGPWRDGEARGGHRQLGLAASGRRAHNSSTLRPAPARSGP